MSKVTVKQAAALTGKSRETINAATKSGKLSSSKNSKNKKVIDVSELERVYPLVKTIAEINSLSDSVKPSLNASDSDVRAEIARLSEKLAASEVMQETITAERVRERRQLEDEIANLRENLSKAQEQHSRALLLITDQSQETTDRVGDWEKSIKALENRLANQEEQAKKERASILEARRYAKRYKSALQAERKKSFWQKLWE